jgi:hypothetical protein
VLGSLGVLLAMIGLIAEPKVPKVHVCNTIPLPAWRVPTLKGLGSRFRLTVMTLLPSHHAG